MPCTRGEMTMVAAAPPREPRSIPMSRLKRFTAAEYDRLTESGVFTTEDRFELLEGFLVNKMPTNEPHATTLDLLEDILKLLLVDPWTFRTQRPILLSGDNRPEPDLVVVKGPKRRFFKHHPRAVDVTLLVEVSEATLDQDRGIKQEMYARDRIPEYWIVNLAESVVEVYTQPKGGRTPGYRRMDSFAAGSSVPLRIEGEEIGVVAVSDLLP
jgi:Uma2 family endonuclease